MKEAIEHVPIIDKYADMINPWFALEVHYMDIHVHSTLAKRIYHITGKFGDLTIDIGIAKIKIRQHFTRNSKM